MGTLTKKIEVAQKPPNQLEHCNECLRDTNHSVLYRTSISWSEVLDDEEHIAVNGADTYSLIQCLGCDSVRLKHAHWFSEDMTSDGHPIVHSDYFPPNEVRQKPSWYYNVGSIKNRDMRDLLDEIYVAVGADALRLAAMGIRALVERIMVDQVGDNGPFENNIAAFFREGYVAEFQQKMFKETLIEAGHAAMHRGWEPTYEDVETLLDVVEGLLKGIYIDPSRTAKMGKRIPPRAAKSKGGGGEACP